MRPFSERLAEAVRDVGTPLCVGIDPWPDRLPGTGRAAALAFGLAVVEAAAGRVAAVKRIALTDLYAHLDAYYSYEIGGHNFGDYLVRNYLWDYLDYYWGWDVTVPGELLGRVRVWVLPNPSHGVAPGATAERFDEALCTGQARGSTEGKMVDPDAAVCASGALSQYFAYSTCNTAGAGGGLWRASAMDGDENVIDADGNRAYFVFGKDFLIDVEWDGRGGWTSPDHLTSGSEEQYLNPSVVQMGDGTWRVYSGGGGLNLFEGAASDGGCA